MRGAFEFTGFAGLALALHVAAFQTLPQGSESTGSGGEALVTVTPVSVELSDMVATWDKPPDIAEISPIAMPQPLVEQPFDVTAARPLPPAKPPLLSKAARPIVPALPMVEQVVPPHVMETVAPPPVPPVDAPPKARPQARPATDPAVAKPKLAPQQAPRVASTAAGRGVTSARGISGSAEAASMTQSARQTLMAEWGGKIRNRIDRAKPRGTGRGSVTIVLTVSREGALKSVGIAASSGHAALDRVAVQVIRSAGLMPAAPRGLTDAAYTFRLPIRFD